MMDDLGQGAESAARDAAWMREAIAEARRAASAGDVPVGAVVVIPERGVVGRGHNRREIDKDPTAHAEVLALREAARAQGAWRLSSATLYVTLEPCPMCAGALIAARIGRVVYGCMDAKAGALDSLFCLGRDPRLNHRFAIQRGVLAQECATLLKDFFAERRRR